LASLGAGQGLPCPLEQRDQSGAQLVWLLQRRIERNTQPLFPAGASQQQIDAQLVGVQHSCVFDPALSGKPMYQIEHVVPVVVVDMSDGAGDKRFGERIIVEHFTILFH